MAYIANMPDGQLPAWLSANRLMLWNLRALRDLGGRAHLDVLYRRLGQLLRIPEDLLWLEHPTGARQEDYVIRHRMRFALTDLGFLGLVVTNGQGNWSLLDEGADFLNPLDGEDAPMAERDWSRETGIELTRAESELETKLNWMVLGKLWITEGPWRESLAYIAITRSRSGTGHPDPGDWWQRTAPFKWTDFSKRLLREYEPLVRERRHSRFPDTLIAKFEGTCVICERPINIGDAIAISFQDASLNVEGWRHDRCSRRGPGGAAVPAWVPKPGNSPRRPAVRRRRIPTKGDD